MSWQPSNTAPKSPGDLIRSQDWNELVEEVKRLSAAQGALEAETSTRLFIENGTGNVGIGTTQPQETLHVAGGIRAETLMVSGSIIRKVAVATGLGPIDQQDNGQIVSRVLKFTKHHADTAIRIVYCDNIRVAGSSAVSARWEIRVNGVPPPNGAIYQDKHSQSGNDHDPTTIVGYAEGLAAGNHEIQIWVGPVSGTAPSDAYTGWLDSRWTLEAEEVWKA